MEKENQRALHPLSEKLGIPLYIDVTYHDPPPPLSKTNNKKPPKNNFFKSILHIFLKLRE